MQIAPSLAIGRLNHVGIATRSIPASLKMYAELFGAGASSERFALPPQGVWVCFVDLPNSQIELIEPYGVEGPIHSFLERNPAGGLHHICFEVPDIAAAAEDLRSKGARVLGAPRIGAHGVPVIFVHPKDSGGVLVELMKTPDGH